MAEENQVSHEAYREEWRKRSSFLHDPEYQDRDLTPFELEQLGIDYDPYTHNKEPVGKACFEFKGKRMEVVPESGNILGKNDV
ncbi:hypothetical protein FACS189447_09590 [Spirochaetia bacterium]|nr:hypothetical protein FACS189447_09590 [Spirochaetia bacterium]